VRVSTMVCRDLDTVAVAVAVGGKRRRWGDGHQGSNGSTVQRAAPLGYVVAGKGVKVGGSVLRSTDSV
jgi:hypothetical protein